VLKRAAARDDDGGHRRVGRKGRVRRKRRIGRQGRGRRIRYGRPGFVIFTVVLRRAPIVAVVAVSALASFVSVPVKRTALVAELFEGVGGGAERVRGCAKRVYEASFDPTLPHGNPLRKSTYCEAMQNMRIILVLLV